MILLGVIGLLVTVSVTASVWASTEDAWVAGQAGSGALACVVAIGVVVELLGRFSEAKNSGFDDTLAPDDASPSWLVPGLSTGDGSVRHLRTRTHPALRDLARGLVFEEHGLNLDDPADEEALKLLLGDDVHELLVAGGDTLGHGRRQANTDIRRIVEGLEGA